MAMPEASSAPALGAQVVGNAFVEQYYHILHQSPELVYRFYQDASFLSRPDINGAMTTVTTMQAINDKILSLNYKDYTVEIKSADAQESYQKGVIVLVTGCLTGKDEVERKFTQTFFLAPQDVGYFVFNDVFRYVEDNETVTASGSKQDAPIAALPLESEPTQTVDHLVVDPVITFEADNLDNGAEVCDPSDNEEESVIEEEVVDPPLTHSHQSENLPEVDSVPVAQEDSAKKSYASIVKVPKGVTGSTPVYVPRRTVKATPSNTDQKVHDSVKAAPAPETSGPAGDSALGSSNVPEEAEGHSIYVRNLPYDATVAQLEEEFKKFGPIKRGGIQVRSNKGITFGFVEFETLGNMQKALEASPIPIGDCQAVIEEKRTTTRVGRGGRYFSGRVGYRSDNFRGRGNFSGSRGYGRSEFRNQGEHSGRPRGLNVRNGEGYQRVNQNGSGRGGNEGGGVNRSSSATEHWQNSIE